LIVAWFLYPEAEGHSFETDGHTIDVLRRNVQLVGLMVDSRFPGKVLGTPASAQEVTPIPSAPWTLTRVTKRVNFTDERRLVLWNSAYEMPPTIR
jgi:hypothetical protein